MAEAGDLDPAKAKTLISGWAEVIATARMAHRLDVNGGTPCLVNLSLLTETNKT